MGITAKSSRAKTTTTTTSSPSATDNNSNRGMGFLLVFFPDDKTSPSPGAGGSPISDGKQIAHRYDYSLSSPSSADSPGNAKPAMKRSNSSNPILTKTQSTISVCAFLVLFSFLLFALSTFEPPIPPHPVAAVSVHRRFLSERPPSISNHHQGGRLYYWLDAAAGGIVGRRKEAEDGFSSASAPHSFALQGMGRLYRRGTRSMADLLVGHVAEDTTEGEFRLFLRLFHRSGLASRADVVFLFPSSSASRSGFEAVIREENDSFSSLLRQHCARNHSESKNGTAMEGEKEKEKWSWSRFDAGRFVKRANRSKGMAAAAAAGPMETTLLWGKKIRLNATINGSYSPTTTAPTTSRDGEPSSSGGESTTRVSYGSVVGFEANELDPENSLSGFLSNPQMSLRRWACYPMLLGRVKRNFKHIMLADVKSTLILGPDPLTRVRNRAPESLIYFATAKHDGKRGGGKKSTRSGQAAANPAVLMGGGRGIRRFSAAMLTEIVRAAMQHNSKKKTGVTDSGILTHLLLGSSGEHILKNIKLMPSPDSIPDAGEAEEEWGRHYSIIQRGGGNYSGGISGSSNNNNNYHHHDDGLNSVIMKRICSCDDQDLLAPPVYKDCYSSSRELL